MGAKRAATCEATVSVLEPPPVTDDASKVQVLAPLAAYFPSGLQPCAKGSDVLEFDVYTSRRSKKQRAVVASKVGPMTSEPVVIQTGTCNLYSRVEKLLWGAADGGQAVALH
jgi:hypothetical protein